MWRYLLTLTAFIGVSHSVASYAQVVHGTTSAAHDTINYGSGGGGSGGNANYATTAGNANTANYATQAGSANALNSTSYCNPSASGYCYTFADTTHITLNANGLAALSIDSALNSVFSGNVTLPAANMLAWLSRTRLMAPADGTLQVVNSAGAFATLLLGGTTDSTGIQLVPSNGSLAVLGGAGGNGMQIATGKFKATSSVYSAQNGGTATSPVYTAAGANTGVWFPSATSIGFTTNGVNALTLDTNQNATLSASLFLPNSVATGGLYFGPASATNTRIFQNGSGVLQFGISDGSGNATAYAAKWGTANDLGVGAPQFFASYQSTYGVYVRNSTPAVGFVGASGWLLQADTNGIYNFKKNVQSKTANYTLTSADSGVNFDNTGATGAITFTLPAVTSGINACFSTTAAQTISVTTPSGSIVGGSYSTGATRSVNTQYTTFCVTAHGSNYVIDMLVGTIAS